MADDGKRSEMISVKVTERMALDLLRLSSSQDRSMSDFLFVVLRQRLYGEIVRLDAIAEQMTKSDKVDRMSE
ncbi:MAG: hypothetical protein ABI478_10870 [Propionivibrio sp.]